MKGDFSRRTFARGKHYSAVLLQQGRVQLDADWNESQAIHEYRSETMARDVIGVSGAPTIDPGFLIQVDRDGVGLLIGQGRYYVDGLLCENDADISYMTQADLPGAEGARDVLQKSNAVFGLVYLEVWKRHLTALDDAAMRESALGGPDSTTRLKIVWQVKVLPVKTPASGVVGPETVFEEWTQLLTPPTGALSARAKPVIGNNNPCIIPPSAGYRGLENQLYRVEIHKGGVLGDPAKAPTFKWSRDNGTVVTAIERLSGQELTVRDLGPDEVLGFVGGQWVEIIDDATELNRLPGQLIQIESVNPATRVIKLMTAPSQSTDLPAHPKLRRWDSVKDITMSVPATNEGFLPLENGLEVKFTNGTFVTGDYWLIPARTAINGETGTIEWPFTVPQLPQGIVHHYSRLALLQRNPQTNTLNSVDARRLFPPLTGVGAMHVVGTSWRHDEVMTVQSILDTGLQVTLDTIPSQPSREAPDAPPAVNPGTFIVTLETPTVASTDANAMPPRVETILSGTLTASGNSLVWKPDRDVASFLKLLEGPPSLRFVRVTLKGHKIWSVEGGQLVYLDGQVFAKPGVQSDGRTPRTDLLFPSGIGMRASDFESWFYLPAQMVSPPPRLVGLTVTPTAVQAGQAVSLTVTLDRQAPSGGVVVTLTKTLQSGSDPIPSLAPVTIPEGQAGATITVQTLPNVAAALSVKATLRDTEAVVQFNVQVVAVTISPSSISLLVNGSVQVTALVTGSTQTAVNFAIAEGARGGALAQTSTNTATYTAPALAGVFHVVATSVADPSRNFTATITVVAKRKDNKEGKELVKEQVENPKLIRDSVEKIRDKVRDTKVTDLPRGLGGAPSGVEADDRAGGESGRRSTTTATGGSHGKAFIKPEERPPVGEPQRRARKPRSRNTKRTPKSGKTG
ncbi:MAG: hypothetical protein KF722_02110 [Nitrospira sp.]|nr:hypothetical protein [Nitrospira sp.]